MQFARHPTALFLHGQLLGVRIETSRRNRHAGVGSQHLDEPLIFGATNAAPGGREEELAEELAAVANGHAEEFDQPRTFRGIPGEVRMSSDIARSNPRGAAEERTKAPGH